MNSNERHKLLMLSRHFPPAQTAGSHRIIRLGRYLPEFGWDCVAGTSLEGCWGDLDPTLCDQIPPAMAVHRFPCRDPQLHLDMWLEGRGADVSFLKRFPVKLLRHAIWTISSPDSAIWQIGRIYRDIARIVEQERPDAIWITGTPFSWFTMIHRFKRDFGLPVVLDLRDPWTLAQLRYKGPRWVRKWPGMRHERRAFAKADAVVFNTPRILEMYRQRYPTLGESKFHCLTNGYVRDDIDRIQPEAFDRFTVVHGGATNLSRHACSLIAAMGRLRQAGAIGPESFRYVSYGAGTAGEHDAAAQAGVSDMVEFRGRGSHEQVIAALKGADAMFVMFGPSQKRNIPCKIYEYFAAGGPIVAAGPRDSDAANLLTAARTGPVVEYDDVDGLTVALEALFQGQLPDTRDKVVIASKDARALAGELATILDAAVHALPGGYQDDI
jgi:hypothetical protein